MVNLVAKSDRKRRRIFTIQYEPIGVIVEVQGREIREIRREAGLVNQKDFAEACGWSASLQRKYESDGWHEMPLEKILKMIRVCNGSE